LLTIYFVNYLCRVATKNTPASKTYEETPLAFNLNTLAKLYIGIQSRQFNELDIDRYFFVLSLIIKHKNATQQCLSNCLTIDKASMVRIIDYLTENGYVKRELNPNDRREYIIVPTARAEKLYPKLVKSFRQNNEAAFEGFTKTEKETFYAMLERMFQNLSGLPADKYFIKYVKTEKKKRHEK